MAQLTGGQAIVQSLKRHGIDTMFVLPGIQLDNIFDALYDEQDHFKLFHTRHEQACSYMADGFARTTGKPGVCLVVPGPGLLNAMAGLSTAYACSAPVLAISGQIQSDMIGVGRGLLHEIPEQLQCVASVTKWAKRIETPEDAPSSINEAFVQMLSGRPRPVEVEMAPDIMGLKGDVQLLDPSAIQRQAPDTDQIRAAAKALANAKKPMIFVGGGIFDATEELLALAEMLQAPVVMSNNGKGAIDARNYLAHNGLTGKKLWKDTDVVLAVGTRFLQPLTQWAPDDEMTIIQMDVDAEEIGRNYKPNVGILADAKLGLTALLDAVSTQVNKRDSRESELRKLQEWSDDLMHEIQPQASWGDALRAELPEDGILIAESTQVGYWSGLGFPVYKPRTYLTSGYQGTLGYGFATALGAQVGNMDKRVISINGDGGFMYNVQELSTAARFNIPLITVVFNDNAFGNVKRIQQEQYRGRTIASDLTNPDFVKMGESFGVFSLRAETPEQLQAAIQEGYRHNGPVLIEVPVDQMPNPGKVTGWGAPAPKSRKDL